MKKILLLTVTLLGAMLLPAQGVYQLWGMTPSGGKEDLGVIFKTDGAGKNPQIEHHFSIKNQGADPYATLTGYNGKFYGTTVLGGKYNAGVIFEWDPATNIYTKKYDLDETNGSRSYSSLTLSNNKFYGMTSGGGNNGEGVIFEWDPILNVYTKKIDLVEADGRYPRGSLVYNAGKFYGVTPSGGSANGGVIFEWDPVVNIYTKKVDLVQSGEMILDCGDLSLLDGKFYGMTYSGGVNDRGVIFEWDPVSNIYTKKIDLSVSLGCNPSGNSLTANNGKFYGMTSRGGLNDAGVIFEWDPLLNIYTKKIDLVLSNGGYPQGSLTFKSGKFYGMNTEGGVNSEGVIFEWDPFTNVYTKKIDLGSSNGRAPRRSLALSNGKLYGTASSGGSNSGAIFEWNPSTNLFTKKIDFNLNNGSQPSGGLTYKDGKLYGMTFYGGSKDNGVIFQFDPVFSDYKKKADFDDGTYHPVASLTWRRDKFYGMTMAIDGTVFEWDTSMSTVNVKYSFSSYINGSTPYGNLTELDGALYGMTSDGGAQSQGTYGVIFRLNPDLSFQKLFNFNGLNGRLPHGSLTAYNGKLYGMTVGGGVNDQGVIFEFDPALGDIKKIDLNITIGGNPHGNLVLYQGKFYGTTSIGGANNLGVIFQWDPVTNLYIKKYDFGFTNGGSTNIILHNDRFYGMANGVFEWNPATNVYTKMTNSTGTNLPGGNDLSLAPAPVSNGVPGSCKTFAPVTINSSNNNKWVSITDEDNNAVAEIKANGNNLGIVTASMFINNGAVREDGTGRLYLDRGITIQPQFAQRSPVDIRLYIKATEFTALKNASNSFGQTAGINSINDLGIFKVNGGCAPAVTKISNLISTTGAVWENGYVLSASVNSFTSFYFASKTPCAAPVISAVTASPVSLSPANHQMIPVTVNYSAKGNCFPITTWLTVNSNEAVSGTGNGDLSPDWIIIDDHHVQLRAERADGGTGRIYTITVNAKNAFGTYCKKAIKVTVPYQRAALAKSAGNGSETGVLNCSVTPNPSGSYFNLQVTTASDEKIEVSLFDISGRLVRKMSTVKNQQLRFGNDLKRGEYLIKVLQGEQQQVMKLIKQ